MEPLLLHLSAPKMPLSSGSTSAAVWPPRARARQVFCSPTPAQLLR